MQIIQKWILEMIISDNFKDRFEDENRMPDIFYEWLKVCPVLWVRGKVHSDCMTYLFDSSGKTANLNLPNKDNIIDFAQKGSKNDSST